MKIVINTTFGGFYLGEEYCKKYNTYPYDYNNSIRTDPQLVKWVENHPNDNPSLTAVEIPEEATDWMINEYDGAEQILYVLDGKIHGA